jgi:7-cyano-7-deazaguanine synthase
MKVLLSLSGGLDSAVLLARALRDGHAVRAVSFTYGSKHNPHEWNSAQKVAEFYGVKLLTVDAASVFRGFDSALLSPDKKVPEGHYEEESMRATVVPCRNLIFGAILAGLAESQGLDQVWLGTHSGDHFIYPDCRPQFNRMLSSAAYLATRTKVDFRFPFEDMDKTEIVKEGILLSVPFEKTRTCYTSDAMACGKCGSCQERLFSFAENGREDPLTYRSRTLTPRGE